MRNPGTVGLTAAANLHVNLSAALLVEAALKRQEAILADNGALVAYTGEFTGRTPKDKYFVATPPSKDHVNWGANQAMEPAIFNGLIERAKTFVDGKELFVVEGFACADPAHRLPVRVIAEKAWQALFARCLLQRSTPAEHASFTPQLEIYALPSLRFDPEADGIPRPVAVALSLDEGLVLIAGTEYAGEIKKSVFTYLNYWMPFSGVFPMHCAANVGPANDSALFFGLSGTGKTTLSADAVRRLIGDDEHGWSANGVFNFEGGCYAKMIGLSQTREPQIWSAIRFGAVLENVVVDPHTRKPNYDDVRFTENTRAAYPIEYIPHIEPSQRGGHPSHIFFLTCDAFGVLPPLSKLTPAQAMYHFLSGYTAKVAGTEAGVTEPQATFSTCFGAPFLPLAPVKYAEMLRERLERHKSQVWFVNTGWMSGPAGKSPRVPLEVTRAMIRAVLNNDLNDVSFKLDPAFGLSVPVACPGVPPKLLLPRDNWHDVNDYDRQVKLLKERFRVNFERFANQTDDEIKAAGPS